MIESNISNVNAAATRQDVRNLQEQRATNANIQAEQASSQPMASSGVEAADNLSTNVASQPAGVVTRLHETTEEVPLYEASRPSGTIIRPAIEIAQNAHNVRETPTTEELNAQQEQLSAARDEQLVVQGRPAGTSVQEDSVAQMQKLV